MRSLKKCALFSVLTALILGTTGCGVLTYSLTQERYSEVYEEKNQNLTAHQTKSITNLRVVYHRDRFVDELVNKDNLARPVLFVIGIFAPLPAFSRLNTVTFNITGFSKNDLLLLKKAAEKIGAGVYISAESERSGGSMKISKEYWPQLSLYSRPSSEITDVYIHSYTKENAKRTIRWLSSVLNAPLSEGSEKIYREAF